MAFVSCLPLGLSALCPTGQLRPTLHQKCVGPAPSQQHRHPLITPSIPFHTWSNRNRHAVVCNVEADTSAAAPAAVDFSAQGMTVDDFFHRSIGEWKSQRSSHNLIWAQFEQITSDIVIANLDQSDDEVVQLCDANNVAVADPFFSFKMEWEGESDWDDEVSQGASVMCVIKDSPTHGRLLRSVGYAETIPAVGQWHISDQGVFVLKTFYDSAAAEERIWFSTPHLRMRVSQILTSSGTGVVTASFSTEIRRLNIEEQ